MKILFLSSLYSPHMGGGAEVVVQRTVEGLQARGDDVVVLATGPQPGLSTSYVRGVKVYRAGLLNTYWHYSEQRPGALARLGWHLRDRYNSGMNRFIAEVIEREAVELVVCNNLAGWSVAAWDEVHKAGLPVVQVLHDLYLMCPGSNMFKKQSPCATPCALCRSFRQGHAERSAKVDAVVGVSNYLLERLRSQRYFRGAHAQVIYSATLPADDWLSLGNDGPRELGQPLRFGFIGTLSEQKGLRWLIQQFRKLPFPATLSIAGRGQQDYERELHALAEGAPNIEFLGYQSADTFYRQIDVAVVPSIWNEPFGLVAVEACSHALPVIASQRGGLPEIIRDGVNGLICDPDDPASLGLAMRRLWQEPVLRDRLASQARASVERFQDLDAMLEQYQQLFRQVLEQRSPRHDNDLALHSL